MTSETDLAFYASHSVMTDPGRFADLLDGAPQDERELARWVRNVQFHEYYATQAKLDLPPDASSDPASSDPTVRYLEPTLGRILARDDRPLASARPKNKCFIGTCRDYALLFCALLRHQGRPARLRCGFAVYYEPDTGFGADHWVTEVWDAAQARWRLVDAEVDPELPQHRVIAIDPFDIPRDRFQVAGSAWRRVRAGEADPNRFGVLWSDIVGEWFLAGNVLRDLAALNKQEVQVFDWWGLAAEIGRTGQVTADQAAVIDGLAAVIADEDQAVETLRQAYRGRPDLPVGNPVTSWPKGIETEIRLTWT